MKLPCDLIEFGLCLTECGFMEHYTMYLISLIKQIEIAFVGSKTGRLLIPSNSTDIFFHQMFVFFVVEKKNAVPIKIRRDIQLVRNMGATLARRKNVPSRSLSFIPPYAFVFTDVVLTLSLTLSDA